jgi:hypothetical protein
MRLRCANADAERVRDLFVAFAFRDQLHNLTLFGAESLSRLRLIPISFRAIDDLRKENLRNVR